MRARAALSFVLCLLVACGGGGLGGVLGIDGGRTGTGILASVRGSVVSAGGSMAPLVGVRVRIEGTEIEGVTDPAGAFLLEGDIEGNFLLVFEDDESAGVVSTEVFVPTGGRVDLEELDVDFETQFVGEGRVILEFEGTIDSVDCDRGVFFVSTRFNRDLVSFEVALEDAVIEDTGGVGIACQDLSAEFEVEIYAVVDAAGTIVDAVVVLENESGEEDDPEGGDEPEGAA